MLKLAQEDIDMMTEQEGESDIDMKGASNDESSENQEENDDDDEDAQIRVGQAASSSLD